MGRDGPSCPWPSFVNRRFTSTHFNPGIDDSSYGAVLDHTKLESTVGYVEIEVADAPGIAEQTEA